MLPDRTSGKGWKSRRKGLGRDHKRRRKDGWESGERVEGRERLSFTKRGLGVRVVGRRSGSRKFGREKVEITKDGRPAKAEVEVVIRKGSRDSNKDG